MDCNCAKLSAFSSMFHGSSTHFGAGSPSASHSMMNGFSVSPYEATWNSISSAIGCLIIRGGEWTVKHKRMFFD